MKRHIADVPKCPTKVPHTLDFWLIVALLATARTKKEHDKIIQAIQNNRTEKEGR